ncbi:uncharacterized protein CC84DRAFT_1217282 [Paraphaeosphaeria sporulosa]|uniref:Uncharacterized protein n=1 Tax=Paraphaeosphaeria sporulosa TaxID=1460663 RepID=A0A177CGU2_9PLEO|nr:uncharacterized protein CC84DRAFT_1217282 [Paraphaeosphaeria sporulosa]OAG06000.1 hypothetical protein CC84DRAFT_1217282 [Paraphaeosphaeria sporulosa]
MISANFRDIQHRFYDNPGWAPQRRELELVATLTERRIDMGSKSPADHFYQLYYAQHNNVQEMRQALITPSDDPFVFRSILDEFVFTENSIVEAWNMSRLGGVTARIPEADIPNDIKNFPLRSAADDLLSHEGRAWIPPNLPLHRRTFGNGPSIPLSSAPLDQFMRPEPTMAPHTAPAPKLSGAELKHHEKEKPLPNPLTIAARIAGKMAFAANKAQIGSHNLIMNNAPAGLHTSTQNQVRIAPLFNPTAAVMTPTASKAPVGSHHWSTGNASAASKDHPPHQAQVAPPVPAKRTNAFVRKGSLVRNLLPVQKASRQKTGPRKTSSRTTSPRKAIELDPESSSDEDRSFQGSKRAIAQGRKNARDGIVRRSGRARKLVYGSLDEETLNGNGVDVNDKINTSEKISEMAGIEMVYSDSDNRSETSAGHVDTMDGEGKTINGNIPRTEQDLDAVVDKARQKSEDCEESDKDLSDVPDDLSDMELGNMGCGYIRNSEDDQQAAGDAASASFGSPEVSHVSALSNDTDEPDDHHEVDVTQSDGEDSEDEHPEDESSADEYVHHAAADENACVEDIYDFSWIDHSDVPTNEPDNDSTSDYEPAPKKRRHH